MFELKIAVDFAEKECMLFSKHLRSALCSPSEAFFGLTSASAYDERRIQVTGPLAVTAAAADKRREKRAGYPSRHIAYYYNAGQAWKVL